MQSFRFFLVVISAICLNAPMLVAAAENSWIKPNSGNWEEQPYWSLGVLPDATQSVLFTNAGWKALALGANTAQNFPQSMRVQSLRVDAPVDSFNTLLINWTGFEVPLQTTSLTVGSNGSVAVHGSVLEVIASTNFDSGRLIVNGSFIQSDLSEVKAGSLTVVKASGLGDGTYFLTNGILTVGGIAIGGFNSGRFVQYGGSNNVGGVALNPGGEYELHGGQLTATSGITVGMGDFADYSTFFQHGGSVNADTYINGDYVLNGGTITGRMSLAAAGQRVDASILQNGGTNFAVSLDMGHPNRFGGRGTYVLSNGAVRVESSVTFRGGEFAQYNGQHTIVSNLVMRGTELGTSFGFATAQYVLSGGTLSASGLTGQAASFQQHGGTNLIAGDIVLTAAPPQPNHPPESTGYTLSSGLLSARNITVDTFFGGFRQTGGSSHITDKLTVQVQAATNGSSGYTLEGGSLSVTTISISNAGAFHHTGGVSQVTQLFVLPGANQRADYWLTSGRLDSARVYLGTSDPNGTRGFFTQSGGVHSNSQSIVAYGKMVASDIMYFSGTYELSGGLLLSPGIGLDGGMFSQSGGTNYTVQLSLTNGGSYLFAGGTLMTSNTVVENYARPAARPRFVTASGAEHRTKRLYLESGGMYHLARGGTLAADMISARAGTELRLAGTVLSNNTLEVNGGVVRFEGNNSLGWLLFNGISHFDFSGPSIVHFTMVGYRGGALDGELLVHNWDPGWDQFYIHDTDPNTPSRVQNIKFVDPAGYPPGTYRAWRKANDEIVPLVQPEITFTRQGNTMVLTWPEGYQLYSSDKVTGPFEPMNAQSGWSANFSDPQRFFLLRSAP